LPDAKRPKAVLFDVDGTLVDSNDAHARSWCDLLEEYGYPTELGRIRRMIGMGGDKIIATVTDLDANSARAKELLAARTARFFKEYFPSVRAIPGGRELFERLRADGLRVAIATSAKPATPKQKMRAKLDTESGRAVYAKRKTIVEPVFGQIKEVRGFRRFLLRGLAKIRGEWRLVCLTHNLLKIWRYGSNFVFGSPCALIN